MNVKILVCAALLAFPVLGFAATTALPASTSGVTIPDNLTWHTLNSFPPGAKAAIISGSPRHAGPFVVLVSIPANYQVPPCLQTIPLSVKLLSGSYHIGVGDTFDTKTTKTMPSSKSFTIPANKHLFFWSPNGALFQVSGTGPWNIQYANPKDDPRNS